MAQGTDLAGHPKRGRDGQSAAGRRGPSRLEDERARLEARDEVERLTPEELLGGAIFVALGALILWLAYANADPVYLFFGVPIILLGLFTLTFGRSPDSENARSIAALPWQFLVFAVKGVAAVLLLLATCVG
jgi:hypothetical protein